MFCALRKWFSTTNEYLKVTLAILLVMVAALPILTYPLGPDQGIFATGGRAILQGDVLYVDIWDFKPPAIFYVYSAFISLFGETTFAIRVIDLAMFPALGWSLYWIAKQLGAPLAGILTIFGLGAFYFTESFWTLTQNEGVALLPMTLLVMLMLRAMTAQYSARWLFMAGMMAGVVFWFKYPFAVLPALLMLGYLFNMVTTGAQSGTTPLNALARRWRDTAAFTGGGVLVVGAVSVYLQSIGAFAPMLDILEVTLGYAQGDPFPEAIWQQAVNDRWSQWGVLLPFIVIGLFFYRRMDRQQRNIYLILWLWLLSGIVIMLAQAKGYDYHWLPMLPPALLLASAALTMMLRRYPVAIAAVIGLLLVVQFSRIWLPAWGYLTGQQAQLAYYEQFRGGAFVADEMQQVVEYLNAHTTDGESLFIYGFHTQIYYLTGLTPATRYVFHVPLVGAWYPAIWQVDNVQRLWGDPPPYVVVVQGDFMPWMTGQDADSKMLLHQDTELNNWLIYNYTEAENIGLFTIFQRKAEPGI